MSDFFRTRMGAIYYDHTLPELVRQLTRIADLLERLIVRKGDEQSTQPGQKGAGGDE